MSKLNNLMSMFCTNCGKQIPDDSSFCEFCGIKVVAESQMKTEKNSGVKKDTVKEKVHGISDIKNETLRYMASHLEFLGYQIEREEIEQNKELITATHPTNNNFLFFEMSPDFILFKAGLRVDKKPTQEMDAAINLINKALLISRVYYDTDGKSLTVIRVEAAYQGKYIKEGFARFHEFFEKDQQLMTQVEEFKAFLKD